jgi:hypothetical protein
MITGRVETRVKTNEDNNRIKESIIIMGVRELKK